jgi:TolB-like protein/class 3 adenylate cyclase/lipopolysaccharide biosynthesis regulator YciM
MAIFAEAEMPEGEANAKVEIAHVLTMDVVEYSKLLITEQARVIAELTNIVKNTEQFRLAEAAGKLVRIPTGDGMALVFFDDPQAPIDCAVEIAMALKNHAEIRLRSGIHSGPVNQVVDVSERPNVAGAGIDMAQRVMDCGDAGHILVSKRVADDLAPFPKWNPYLHELGECEIKHGRKISLVNFYTDKIGNPQRPKKCPAARSAPRIAVTVSAVLLVVVALGLVWSLDKFRKPSSAISLPPKSIAVLPFENLSHDPDNAYFADGIQEEILTRLSKIAELKVISRTSTRRFRSKPENLGEIAKQLGVAHILEGAVQKVGDQVRVNVQLINAQNDSHLWADEFDRKLQDIFAVETEIATKIADTLRAKLSGREQRAIAVRPTENTGAYQLYLQGRHLWGQRNETPLLKAVDYFNQALAKDPNYAQAYSGIADCYSVLPYFSRLNPRECLQKARLAADKALELDNELAEAHASLGILLMSEGDAADAQREFLRAIDLDPNYSNAYYWYGWTFFVPLGRFDEGIAQIKRAIELDPLSAVCSANLAESYRMARRYPEAIAQARKTIELEQGFSYGHGVLGSAFDVSGQFDQAISEYEMAYELSHDFHILGVLGHAYGLKGDRAKALQSLEQLQDFERQNSVWNYSVALVYLALGDKNEALNRLEQSYRAGETGSISYIKVDPMLDPLRGDPRFEKLVDQVIPPDALP